MTIYIVMHQESFSQPHIAAVFDNEPECDAWLAERDDDWRFETFIRELGQSEYWDDPEIPHVDTRTPEEIERQRGLLSNLVRQHILPTITDSIYNANSLGYHIIASANAKQDAP